MWRNPNNLGYRRKVATARERDRCRERLAQLCESGLDTEAIQREAVADLRRVIGFDRWCWVFADPKTLLPLGGVAEHDYGPGVARSLELEYSGADFATMGTLARRTVPVGSLSAETGRDLARSPRWDEILRPVGIGDEAALACRDALGCWGWIKAYRDRGDPAFSGDDLALLAAVGPSLGSALRRGIAGAAPTADGPPSGPGVIVLDADLRPVSWSPAARDWAATLPGASIFAAWGILPPVVYPAAALARSGSGADETRALEQAVDGRWVRIEATPLEGEDGGRIAVILRGAAPAETFELLCRAYALTARERQVVAALIAGDDTRAVAERLVISRHTVQDHLKAVFAKVGVRSRRELLARFSGSQVQRELGRRPGAAGEDPAVGRRFERVDVVGRPSPARTPLSQLWQTPCAAAEADRHVARLGEVEQARGSGRPTATARLLRTNVTAGRVPGGAVGRVRRAVAVLDDARGVDGDGAERLGGDALGRDAARGERGADRAHEAVGPAHVVVGVRRGRRRGRGRRGRGGRRRRSPRRPSAAPAGCRRRARWRVRQRRRAARRPRRRRRARRGCARRAATTPAACRARATSACSIARTGVAPTPALSSTTGRVAVAQDEAAARGGDVEHVADLHVVVQVAAAGALALDADPVAALAGHVRQRVAADQRRRVRVRPQAHGQVLARPRARRRRRRRPARAGTSVIVALSRRTSATRSGRKPGPRRRRRRAVGLGEQLAEAALPALAERRDAQRPLEQRARLAGQVEQRVDVARSSAARARRRP